MRPPSASGARLWAVVTALIGAAMTAMPSLTSRWAAGRDGVAPATTVVRILGSRQMLQGIAVAAHPTRAVVGIGSLVDVTHAATMAAAVVLLPRYRRSAAVSGVLAAASAAAGTAVLLRGGQ